MLFHQETLLTRERTQNNYKLLKIHKPVLESLHSLKAFSDDLFPKPYKFDVLKHPSSA